MKIICFQHTHFIQSTFHQARRRYAVILLHQRFFQRSAVNANTNRHMVFLCRLYHFADILLAANVARIDPDLIGAVFHGGNCQLIIKMNISHQWNMDSFLNLFQRLCSFLGRNRTADNITSCFFQRKDLLRGFLHIFRFRVRH